MNSDDKGKRRAKNRPGIFERGRHQLELVAGNFGKSRNQGGGVCFSRGGVGASNPQIPNAGEEGNGRSWHQRGF